MATGHDGAPRIVTAVKNAEGVYEVPATRQSHEQSGRASFRSFLDKALGVGALVAFSGAIVQAAPSVQNDILNCLTPESGAIALPATDVYDLLSGDAADRNVGAADVQTILQSEAPDILALPDIKISVVEQSVTDYRAASTEAAQLAAVLDSEFSFAHGVQHEAVAASDGETPGAVSLSIVPQGAPAHESLVQSIFCD
ncbi:MAG TPA: hypothetical protein VIM53_00865 [Candidatus Saccharimonadales bacterium]